MYKRVLDLDIAMNGFWGGRSEHAFVDVYVNPFAPSNMTNSMSACYRKHENIKKRAYRQCIENCMAIPPLMVLSA